MCLYPRLIENRKYLPNKKNGGKVPQMKDDRVKYVPVGCGKCMECLKQRAMHWRIRLIEELRVMKKDKEGNTLNAYFVTLTFSDESLAKLEKYVNNKRREDIAKANKKFNKKIKYTPLSGYYLDNKIAKASVKLFRERWRWEYKTSIRHWLVTELGQTSTERLHLHGILFTDKDPKSIARIWQYGNVWIGDYVSERTVNYIVKYLHKSDPKHKYYTPLVLTSPGIGKGYLDRHDSTLNKFKYEHTDETYKTRSGSKLGLPTYYRNKLYTDDEKEFLWLNLLDKNTRYVNGVKCDVSQSDDDYNRLLNYFRNLNKQFGYGDDSINYDQKEYEQHLRNLKRLQAHAKANKSKE